MAVGNSFKYGGQTLSIDDGVEAIGADLILWPTDPGIDEWYIFYMAMITDYGKAAVSA